jgi:cell wall-associated NlpC family hydrolase
VETPFAGPVIEFAVALAGIIPGDSRYSVDVDPFVLLAETGLPAVGTVGQLAGVPQPLLDAVNRAVDAAATYYPACKIDAAFLLANAKEESGMYWPRIQTDGTMVPALENSYTAQGPFQFIRVTWPSWQSDGNGDGLMDPQSTYDSAIAAMRYQCAAAARYDNDLTNDATAWDVATDYHDGPNRDHTVSNRCKTAPQTDGCRGENYATRRVATANEYRQMIAQAANFSYIGGSSPALAGSLVDKAVQYAVAQAGGRYCRDDMPAKCSVPPSTLTRQYTLTSGYRLAPSPSPTVGVFRFGPDAFDCSGLVGAAYMKAGFDIGAYQSSAQLARMPRVPVADMRPGDLMFFNTDPAQAAGHVAMYIGNGKLVHAASHERGVLIQDIYFDKFVGVGRPSLLPGAPA